MISQTAAKDSPDDEESEIKKAFLAKQAAQRELVKEKKAQLEAEKQRLKDLSAKSDLIEFLAFKKERLMRMHKSVHKRLESNENQQV